MEFGYAVALTGGIATGKSTVSKIFDSLGYAIIDADKIAHQVLQSQSLEIAKIFGEKVLRGNGVDREHLGAIVFSNSQKRKRLEALLHPLIFERIRLEAMQLEPLKKPYLVDIPLFFETNRYPISNVLVVYTTQEQQLKRLMKRNGYSEQEALNRIGSQLPMKQKIEKATYLIDNSGSLAKLNEHCIEIDKIIKKDF